MSLSTHTEGQVDARVLMRTEKTVAIARRPNHLRVERTKLHIEQCS